MSYDNFVQCQLVLPVAAAATAITLFAAVAPYRLPPAGGGTLVLADSPGRPSVLEVISYTSRTGLVLNGVTRALDGTTAQNWTGSAFCYQALMAGEYQAAMDSKTSASDVQNGVLSQISSLAGSNTLTGTVAAPFNGYVKGQTFELIAVADCAGGGVTLNLNNKGAKAVTKKGAVALGLGDIKAGSVVLVVYDGTQFQIVSGAGGGAVGDIFYENGQVIDFDYTVKAGRNAGTFGPVSFAAGITVTIETGATWSIV